MLNNNISLALNNDILIILYSPIVFWQFQKTKKEIGIIGLFQLFENCKITIGE